MKQTEQTLADFPEWELEAFADGETRPQVAAFVAQHPAAWQAWLAQHLPATPFDQLLHRFDCPSSDLLRDYLCQVGSVVANRQLQQHLQSCPACTADLRTLQSIVGPRPVAATQSATVAPTPTWPERLATLAEGLKIVIAQLVTPATPALATVALRGQEQPSSPTHLLLEADGVDISIRVQRQADHKLALVGHLFFVTAPLAPARLRLMATDPQLASHEVTLDQTGKFDLAGLPTGTYQLIVALPDQWIVAPNLLLQ